MHQVEIEIVELQIAQRPFTGSNHVIFTVLVVPKLGGDPKLFSTKAIVERILEGFADSVLVAVYRRTIEVPIANRGGAFHSVGNDTRRDVV
jgi:hypothetical protein